MNCPLPIFDSQEKILQALAHPLPARLLLSAPTGTGKSTGIPVILDQGGWTEKGCVLIIEPRRMAARLLAQYVAQQLGSPLGEKVGYRVRFENKSSQNTRLLFVTEGIMERFLLENPTLKGISAVLFDEFHERRLSSDLCLAKVRLLQESARPDIALVVMSATLEMREVEDYLRPCHTLALEAKRYPVEVHYCPPTPRLERTGRMQAPPLWESMLALTKKAVSYPDHGDLLLFLPGSYEIRRTIELLEREPLLKHFEIYPLYSSLSPQSQNQALAPSPHPKILVSTNVAETSLTIEGLATVIDSGLVRQASRDIRRQLNLLSIEKISQSSAKQRKGRAGRLQKGRCFRLWSESEHKRRPEFETPEIARLELSAALLSLAHSGVETPQDFPWLTPPTPEALHQALLLLQNLGALSEKGQLTALGQKMLSYPLEPRLARLLLAGKEYHCVEEMAFIATLIQSENLFIKNGELPKEFREKDDYTDFQAEARAFLEAQKHHFTLSFCQAHGISARASQEIEKGWQQLLKIENTRLSSASLNFVEKQESITLSLLSAYKDHLGVRNGIATHTCKMVQGQSGSLPSGSAAFLERAFLACEVFEIEGKTKETRISRTLALPSELLQKACPEDWKEELVALYDEGKRRVIQCLRTQFQGLTLFEQEKGEPSPEEAAPLLAAQLMEGKLKLPLWDDSVEQWIYRLKGLRQWMPELELPDFDESDKLVALEILCQKALSYKEVKDRPLLPILEDWLSPWQKEALALYAPTNITLCNGQKAKVRYKEDSTPFIGLTVQRLYGVEQSPTIAQGKVTLLVEVLAPNQRPWQVTQNLPSFWKTGYPQMKKDLAGRYPRQQWR